MQKQVIPSKVYEVNPDKIPSAELNNSNEVKISSLPFTSGISSGAKPTQTITAKTGRSALTLNLQLHASSSFVHPSEKSFTNHISSGTFQKSQQAKQAEGRKLGDRLPPASNRQRQPINDAKFAEEALFKKTLSIGLSDVFKNALIKHKLNLTDFRPLKAPFVPYIVKILVNFIEGDCRTYGWNTVFTPSDSSQMELAELHACLLLQNRNYHEHIKRQVKAMSLSLKVDTLRVLLARFKQKPLHFSRQILKEVVKQPLYDLFLRPNTNIKDLVRQTCLPTSRTTMDTLAFMMFHLQHAWKGCVSNVASKTTLAKIYGPLLVSFSERPVITDQDPTSYKTEEAAILEVILEVCDLHFWDNLSMLKMHLAFNSKEDDSEVQAVDPLEDNVAQIPIEPPEYENEAWFSCLFGPKESPSKIALEEEGKDIE
ncbi:unnamed protein product [Rodentolepis nana]|uniref:Rho-GAP domain-containing protein n=1 Tax=Rodentolepis nana TaxID=102285 RepID=A0A0R3TKV1_RODNA|nr:unnamed protein product [Rodentolepis nana]